MIRKPGRGMVPPKLITAMVGSLNDLEAAVGRAPTKKGDYRPSQITMAKLTSRTAAGKYFWKEIVWNNSTSAWVETGIVGDNETGPWAREVQGRIVPDDTIVALYDAGLWPYVPVFIAPEGKVDTPYEMLPADKTLDEAQVDTWDRETAATEHAGKRGVVYDGPRVIYNPAEGKRLLKMFIRKRTYDTMGMLQSIGIEEEVAINQAGPCVLNA